MGEWIESKLDTLVSTNTDSVFAGYPFDEIMYLDTGSITRGKVESYQTLRLNDAPSRAKRLVKNKDIIYSTVRPIQRHYGYIKSPPENLVVSTGFAVITCNKMRLFPKFLYYHLTSDQIVEELDVIADASTSTYPSLKPSDISGLVLRLPKEIEEQKAIASVLSSLDDKIDLLHRQNKTLEAMAETLFRQWFVEEARDDWEEISLGECCEVITKGTTPTTLKKNFVPIGINFIKVNCIDENGNFLFEKFEYIDEETNDLLGRSKLQDGDILYSIAGTIGRLIVVDKKILPANVNQALAIIRVNPKKISPLFIKCCLKDRYIIENLHSKVVQAVQPNLSLGEIANTPVPFPPLSMMKNFINLTEPIDLRQKNNISQIRTLEKLRDTLLPKLMSGEIRVEYEH